VLVLNNPPTVSSDAAGASSRHAHVPRGHFRPPTDRDVDVAPRPAEGVPRLHEHRPTRRSVRVAREQMKLSAAAHRVSCTEGQINNDKHVMG